MQLTNTTRQIAPSAQGYAKRNNVDNHDPVSCTVNMSPVIVLLFQGTAKINEVLVQHIAHHTASLFYQHFCLALHKP